MASVLVNDHAKDSSRFPKYDGGIKSWREGSRIVMKSFLHSKKLLEVVLHGPISRKHSTQQYSGRVGTNLPQEHFDQQYSGRAGTNLPQEHFNIGGAGMQQPQFVTPTASATTASSGRQPEHPSWKILLQDLPTMLEGRNGTKTIGPFGAATVIDMIENGTIDKDSSLISFCCDGLHETFWEPFTPGKELELHKSARNQAHVAPLVLPAHEPEENTEGRTSNDDCNAYHVLVQAIDITKDTGTALLQQIDSIFGYTQSGHELFKWLDARAEASDAHGGLINAQDSLQDVQDFKLPEGELTKETIILKGAAFKTIYFRQPEARWGMKSDLFKAWTAKFPKDPFDDILTQIHSLNLISSGHENVLEDFDKANKMLCALYSHWCEKHAKVIIKPAVANQGELRAAGALVAKGGSNSWKNCFRCWETGHLSFECIKPATVCTRCGLDGAKDRLACGGEYDPQKCMVKGYKPSCRVGDMYTDKLRGWADRKGVKFGVPDSEKSALVVNPGSVTYACINGEWVANP
jgi:hypothetical protein